MGYYKFMKKPATVIDFGLSLEQEEHAQQLHKDIVVFDSLMECSWYDGLLKQMHRGGTTAGSFSIGNFGLHRWQGATENIDSRLEDWWSSDTLASDIGYINAKARENPDDMMLCYSAADIRTAKEAGKVGFMLDCQNSEFVGKDTNRLEMFYNLGIRRVQMTYNVTVAAGAGCMEERNRGLSTYGGELIEKMNELNMLVDTGHCHSSTLEDALDVSKRPIVCSHAGMASRAKNPRTQTDEALKKLADHGGVFGVISTPGALNGTDSCTVNDYLDTIEAAVNLLGIEHVGFGTDFTLAASVEEVLTAPEWNDKLREAVGVNVQVWPWSDGHKGMENNSGYPNLTRGLVARGYNDEDIAKIMGGNFLRIIEDVIG